MANKKVEKKPMDEKRKNYIRNYAILGGIFAVCIFLTLYFCKWYEVYKEYEREIPVIRGSLYEINRDELEHYVVDNSNVILYMCTATSDECRSFEKKFGKYVTRNEIQEEVVYLNLTGIDEEDFLKAFNEKYPYKPKLNGTYPAFVAFRDGKVVSILQMKKNKKVTISKVQNFLELNLQEEEEVEETNEEIVLTEGEE